jgi:membrane protein
MGSAPALEGIFHRPLAGLLPSPAQIVDGFRRSELAIRASSISFRAFYALIPFTLFVLALAGLLSLDTLWTDHLAPEIAPKVSPAVFQILDSTVTAVLSSKQLFWVTIGALLVLWETSSAVRAVMAAFDTIYETERPRSTVARFRRSAWLAVACGACLVATVAVLHLGPLVVGGVFGSLARYLLAAALLWLTVTLLVRFAPTSPQPIGWVSFGSALVVVGWLVTWSAYGLYITKIADPGSAFGALAAIIILLAFLQISTIVLLVGTLVDSLIREEVTGDPQGK